MENVAAIRVVHMTSVHVLTDIRIYAKECMSLSQAGYEVILVGPGESRAARHEREPRVVGVRRPRNRLERMLLTTWLVFWTALRLKADLYHAHDPELLPWLALLKMLGKVVIFDMHEDGPGSILTRPWIPAPLRGPCSKAYRWLERCMLSGLSLICVVDSMAADRPWVSDLTVVRNFPILSELDAIREAEAEKFTIAYIGRVYRERGSEVLLQSAKLCRDHGLDVAIDFVGHVQDDHRRELERMARVLGLENVRIHGQLLPADSWRIAARCHLGAALIKPTRELVHSLPTKALEYLALGKPVLASRLPLLQSIVAETGGGVCVDPDDVEAVARAIEGVSRNAEHWCRAAQRAREIVRRKWTWEQESKKLLRLYRDLLETRAHNESAENARYLVFRLGPAEAAQMQPLPSGLETEVWWPSSRAVLPPASCMRTMFWWLCHHFRVFGNRDYVVFYLRAGARMVHRLSLIPRWVRWPFMAANDLQISDTWTPSEFRGQGLATAGLKMAVVGARAEGRSFWYLAAENNRSSIAVCRKAGFSLYGYARRTAPLGLRALGRFEIVALAASPFAECKGKG